MPARKVSRPVTAVAVDEPRGVLRGDLLGGSHPSGNNRTEKTQVFVDRFGHHHSEAILKNWSPAAIKALGIRPVEEGGAR
jgi:hypothetical protein